MNPANLEMRLNWLEISSILGGNKAGNDSLWCDFESTLSSKEKMYWQASNWSNESPMDGEESFFYEQNRLIALYEIVTLFLFQTEKRLGDERPRPGQEELVAKKNELERLQAELLLFKHFSNTLKRLDDVKEDNILFQTRLPEMERHDFEVLQEQAFTEAIERLIEMMTWYALTNIITGKVPYILLCVQDEAA